MARRGQGRYGRGGAPTAAVQTSSYPGADSRRPGRAVYRRAYDGQYCQLAAPTAIYVPYKAAGHDRVGRAAATAAVRRADGHGQTGRRTDTEWATVTDFPRPVD